MHYRKASPCVARIDAASGRVLGWVDLTALMEKQSARATSRAGANSFDGPPSARAEEPYPRCAASPTTT